LLLPVLHEQEYGAVPFVADACAVPLKAPQSALVVLVETAKVTLSLPIETVSVSVHPLSSVALTV
jgi:hypothetical protein